MDSKILFYLNEMIRMEAGEIVSPVTCEIDPSNQCQNNCSFCISGGREDFSNMSMDFYAGIIAQLSEIGVLSITFTGGGEPTCNSAFFEMAHMAKDAGFKIGLITNGILLNIVPIELFEFIRISLDAGTSEAYRDLKESDNFELVVENIKQARPRCSILGLSYVIAGQGISDMRHAERLAEDLQVDYIQFKPENNSAYAGAKPEGASSIYTSRYKMNGVSCLIAGLIGIVTADGRYIYCCQHRYDEAFTAADLHAVPLVSAIELRSKMKVDTSQCSLHCRYSNYAKAYLQAKCAKYSFMRNKEFL